MPAREKTIKAPSLTCYTWEIVTTVAQRINESYDMESEVIIKDGDGNFFGKINWQDIVRSVGQEIDPRTTPISEII